MAGEEMGTDEEFAEWLESCIIKPKRADDDSGGVRGRGNLEHRLKLAKNGESRNFDELDLEGFGYKRLPRSDRHKSTRKGR